MASVLRQILSGNFLWYELLSYVISAIVVILLVLPLHECAHGFVAYKLGDPTAKGLRRLTLNPFHLRSCAQYLIGQLNLFLSSHILACFFFLSEHGVSPHTLSQGQSPAKTKRSPRGTCCR